MLELKDYKNNSLCIKKSEIISCYFKIKERHYREMKEIGKTIYFETNIFFKRKETIIPEYTNELKTQTLFFLDINLKTGKNIKIITDIAYNDQEKEIAEKNFNKIKEIICLH